MLSTPMRQDVSRSLYQRQLEMTNPVQRMPHDSKGHEVRETKRGALSLTRDTVTGYFLVWVYQYRSVNLKLDLRHKAYSRKRYSSFIHLSYP